MQLSRISNYAVRLSVTQCGTITTRQPVDRVVQPTAVVLAFLGLGVSTFSVKQLLSTSARRL